MSNLLQQFVVVNGTDLSDDQESPTTSTLDILSTRYLALKKQADELKKEIDETRDQICELVGVKDSGTTNEVTDRFKITTTGSQDRKITDLETLSKLAPETVAVKHSLDARAFKALATSNPMLYQKAVMCVETKQRTPSIKIVEK